MSYDPLSDVIDEALAIDESTMTKLHILRVIEKFDALPGESTKEEQQRLSTVLNELLGRLINGIQANPSKLWVLGEFQRSLQLVENEDTEGREHFGTELEFVMDVLGIDSSDGLLAAYLGGI